MYKYNRKDLKIRRSGGLGCGRQPGGGEMSDPLVDEILQVSCGKLTKAEAYGFSDIAVDHVCRFV